MDCSLIDAEEEIACATKKARTIVATLSELIKVTEDSDDEAATPSSLLAAGKIREIEQSYSIAQENYQEAIRRDKSCLEAYARLSLVILKQGDYDVGLATARALVDMCDSYCFSSILGYPTSSMAVLGDANRLNRNYTRAEQAYRAAIKLQPDDTYSVGKLAQILLDIGDFTAAQELAIKLVGDSDLNLKSTIELLGGDPNRLAAVKGLLSNARLSQLSLMVR